MNACHLCGHSGLRDVLGFAPLGRVTSDCRPWPAGGRLAWCPECATVQKPPDDLWRREAAQVYSQYDTYHQSEGVEQTVFVDDGALTRSPRLLDCMQEESPLPSRGTALDFGCGNGVFAKALSDRFTDWNIVGSDISENHREVVESLPRTRFMTQADLESSAERFDLISLIHVLEHIPDPTPVLAGLGKRLAPSGRLLIQVPFFVENPFELLVTDHSSHFTPETLGGLLVRAQLGIEILSKEWIRKELSAVCSLDASGGFLQESATAPERLLEIAVAWLHAIVDAANHEAAGNGIGIFGTSISGTWLAGCVDADVLFFVDEDPARVGGLHLGRPVIGPDAVPSDAPVYVPLPPTLTGALRRRLESAGGRYIYPPQLEYTSGVPG